MALASPMSLSHSQASVSEVLVVRKDSAPLVVTDSLSASSCSPLEWEVFGELSILPQKVNIFYEKLRKVKVWAGPR